MLESHHKALNLRTAALVAASCLLALAFRLPGLGSGSLVAAEQTAFVESQGLDPWAEIAEGEPVTSGDLRRRVGAWAVARGSRFFPLHSGTLALWSGRAGTSEAALRLPSAMAGGLTVALVVWIALQLAGSHPAVAAGLLVALSPIHTLASREAAPGPLLLMVLVLALGLALRLDRESSPLVAAAHGLALGLVAIGPAAFAVVAILQLAWLAARAERRPAAVVSALVALAVFAAAGWGGLLRSPLGEGADLDWVPTTTISGLVRCAGASFMRVAGLEYHLVAPHARHLAPLTLLVLTLVALGARGMTPRRRWLLLGGVVAPFAVGSFLSVVTGQVAPLQAWRMMPALPFVAILAGAGVASLGRWTSRAAAAVVLLSTGASLALALSAAPRETSPTRALAREIERCRPPGAVTSVQRRLDLLALAAWRVPGPLLLHALPAPVAGQRTIRVDPLSACAKGFVPECGSLPECPLE